MWYNITHRNTCYAGVAELADARDLKSRELIPRAGSIPVSGTTNLISRGRAARLARRAHNPEVRRFKSPPRNQKDQTPKRVSVLFGRRSDLHRLSFAVRSLSVCNANAVGTYSANGEILPTRCTDKGKALCR